MGKIIDFLERLPDEQYIAVGAYDGSGFYYIGTVAKYRTDIERITRHYETEPLWEREILDAYRKDFPGDPDTIAILVEGTEAGAYWGLFEVDPNYKRKPRITNMQAFFELKQAIALSACKKYELNYMELGVDDEETTDFFKSEWGELITGADGQKIMDVCRVKAKYMKWRMETGCTKCKRTNCPHENGNRFVTWEKGDKRCRKSE